MADAPACIPIPIESNRKKTLAAIDKPASASSDRYPAYQISVRLYKVLNNMPIEAGMDKRIMWPVIEPVINVGAV